MLKQFRRLEKTRSLIIILFALLLVIGLVVSGLYSRANAIPNPMRSKEAIAAVNGDDVTVADLSMTKRRYEQRMGGQFSLAQLGLTDRRILDNLIDDRIVVQEAERLGLSPSEDEVREFIRQQFTGAGGNFDFKRYKDAVVRNYGDVPAFEQQMRDAVAAQKLRAFSAAGVRVSEDEVQRQYVRDNTTFDLVYVPVTPEQLARRVTPADQELRAFYDEHKTDFRIFEPQKKIRYLFIEQAKVGEKMQIPDEDLRKEFGELKPENRQAGVRAQQIVLRVANPALEDAVRRKAEELVKQLRAEGPTVGEEKFAELARGNSEDPATAKQGGALAGLIRRNPNKTEDPLQTALTMQPGQVSEPIKYKNAYFILRRGDAVEKTFEEAKADLLVSARNRRAYQTTAQLAQRAAERLKAANGDFQAVAQEFAAEANMKPADMVRETPLVKPGDDVPEIGSSPQFEKAVEPLNEPGQVGDRVSIKNGFAIPALVEKREPRIPEFEEVKDKVAERFRSERAKQQVEQVARELGANAASPDALKAAAEKYGLKAETTSAFKPGSPLGAAGVSPAADEAILALKSGEVTKTPVKAGDTWVVAGVTKRDDADLAEFGKQRDKLMEDELAQRRDLVFGDYVASLRARLERDGKIVVYDKVFDRLVETAEPSAPVMPRGLPGMPGQPQGGQQRLPVQIPPQGQ